MQRSLPQGTPRATEIYYLETHHVVESFDFKTKKKIIVIIINLPQGTPHAAKIYDLETKQKRGANKASTTKTQEKQELIVLERSARLIWILAWVTDYHLQEAGPSRSSFAK